MLSSSRDIQEETKGTMDPTVNVQLSDRDNAQKLEGQDEVTTSFYIDPQKEGKMMRKFDCYALLFLGGLYFLANLDRGNLGNAGVAGMPKDIGLIGNQFGTAATLLFATYVPFEAPVAVLLKIVGPKPILAFCAFSWGIMTLCMGFIQNYQGLYALRLLTGFFEAGLIPSIEVYLGLVYKKSERGKRIVLVYSWSAVASAFGGLLAYGLTQITGPNGFAGWRWLFVVEGIITILFVPLFLWLFPADVMDAWFLTAEEKEMMKVRYMQNPHLGIDEKFTWTEFFKVVKDPKWYAYFVMQFCADMAIYSFTTFLPSILNGLGYTSYRANLLTVPVYAVAFCWFVFVGFMSDRTGNRGYWIGSGFAMLALGFILLIAIESVPVRYFACYIVAMGIYPAVALLIMWLCDNVARHFKRATMIGMTLTLANTSGVITGQIFTTDDSPRYIKGLSLCLGLAVLGLIIVGSLMIGMSIVNKKRQQRIRQAEANGTPLEPQPHLGDSDVFFVYSL